MSIKAIAVDPQNPAGFIEISPEMPVPGQYDLLVEVKAVSVNPVDTKVHAGLQKSGLQQPRDSRLGRQRHRGGRRQRRQRLQARR